MKMTLFLFLLLTDQVYVMLQKEEQSLAWFLKNLTGYKMTLVTLS